MEGAFTGPFHYNKDICNGTFRKHSCMDWERVLDTVLGDVSFDLLYLCGSGGNTFRNPGWVRKLHRENIRKRGLSK